MLNLDKSYSDLFKSHGFATYDDFANYKGSTIVSKPGKRVVRTLELTENGQTKKFFVKQEYFEGLKSLIRRLRKIKALHSSLYMESKIIDLCEQSHIPVMKKVAFGEKYIIGIPVGGILVVEEVKGQEFYQVYCRFSLTQKRILAKAFGLLLGRLHQEGIHSIVRVHDLFLVANHLKDINNCLILIDREHGDIQKCDLTKDICCKQIAKILIKGIRFIKEVPGTVLLAFLNGYFERTAISGSARIEYMISMQNWLQREVTKNKYPNALNQIAPFLTYELVHDKGKI